MIKIDLVVIGKIKEAYILEGVSEYGKRMQKYCQLSIQELKEIKISDNPKPSEIHEVQYRESEMMLPYAKKSGFCIATSPQGKIVDSIEFAQILNNPIQKGQMPITFFIGGSYGLSRQIFDCVNEVMSFSKMTFPHQLFRLILLEQIYRAFKIINRETYHK